MQKENLKQYLSVREWVSTYGWLPAGGIRHLIHTNPEFVKRVVKRIGRKILLDCQAFENFINEKKEITAPESAPDERSFVLVNDFCQNREWPTRNNIMHWVNSSNEIARKFIRKINGRYVIDKVGFDKYINDKFNENV